MNGEGRPTTGSGGLTSARDAGAGSIVRTSLLESVSWGAVLAGVVVALATTLVLNLLGLALGAGTLDPGTADNPTAKALSAGAAIWWILAGLISTAAGAYVAARLSGRASPSTGAWHGLITWAVTTLLLFWLVTSAVGGVVGGALRTVTSAAGGAASVVGTLIPTDAMPQAVEELMRGEGSAQVRGAITSLAQVVMSGGEPARLAAAREQAAQAIAQTRGVSINQARAQVAQIESELAQLGQQATQAADAATRAVSQGALWSAIALLLGAGVSALAGRAATVPMQDLWPKRRTTLRAHPTPTPA